MLYWRGAIINFRSILLIYNKGVCYPRIITCYRMNEAEINFSVVSIKLMRVSCPAEVLRVVKIEN